MFMNMEIPVTNSRISVPMLIKLFAIFRFFGKYCDEKIRNFDYVMFLKYVIFLGKMSYLHCFCDKF